MPADGRVYLDDAGQWRWRVRAANGEIIASSEAYTRERDAARGLADAIRTFVAIDEQEPDEG